MEKELDKKKIPWVRNKAWRGPWRRNRVKGWEVYRCLLQPSTGVSLPLPRGG